MQVQPGNISPLGATPSAAGVNFSLYSEHAERVELLLFSDGSSDEPVFAGSLYGPVENCWHGFVEEALPGMLYAYRVSGPFSPKEGQRFNSGIVLLDPFAKDVARAPIWYRSLLGGLDSPSPAASLRYAPLGRIRETNNRPDLTTEGVHPWDETILYETHVRGISIRHPDVPQRIRGTYSGLTSAPILAHLKSLGITSIELLPVHSKCAEYRLIQEGLTNYWGYSPLNYFSPEPSYASSDDPVAEFRDMVDALHETGLEIILDVVYNHTCEGNEDGPTVSFRGIDNRTYYKSDPGNPGALSDYTGTGNTLNAHHPHVQRLIIESLRYWTDEMGVDGFRFDLGVSLSRTPHAVEMNAPFLEALLRDEVLSRKKLIMEPWDLGPDGYQVGRFPGPIREWSDQFRDRVRRFHLIDNDEHPEARFQESGAFENTINFVTAHDGFTLEDLVSYERKHNRMNLEEGRDGHDPNYSINCGSEGPTDNPDVLTGRDHFKRRLFSTLMETRGIPMMLGGDELSRSQRGNNNAYCQDNPISWYDWTLNERKEAFLDYCRQSVQRRRTKDPGNT